MVDSYTEKKICLNVKEGHSEPRNNRIAVPQPMLLEVTKKMDNLVLRVLLFREKEYF